MDFDQGVHAEQLVGRYTEIMPGRPTIAHHRHPYDSVNYPVLSQGASPVTKLCAPIITAAEQQTMNYYMNVAPFYPKEYGRRLYREIGMVEEQHVTHYGSLLDPSETWLACLLNHQYAECFLYWSAMETESDPRIREIWSRMFDIEVSHLHRAAELLLAYEGRTWQQVMPDGSFPAPLKLTSNVDYVRDILKNTVTLTADRESWTPVDKLSDSADFFKYQRLHQCGCAAALFNCRNGTKKYQCIAAFSACGQLLYESCQRNAETEKNRAYLCTGSRHSAITRCYQQRCIRSQSGKRSPHGIFQRLE
jgi:hypothetical protein